MLLFISRYRRITGVHYRELILLQVTEIGETAIDHTIVVRVESTVAEFYARHKKAFKTTVASSLNIGEEQIRILSVVEKAGVNGNIIHSIIQLIFDLCQLIVLLAPSLLK